MSVNKLCPEHPQLSTIQGSELFDDFYNYTSGNAFTTIDVTSGTAAVSATTDQVVLTTGASSGDAAGIATTGAMFLFTAGVGIYAEAYINTANLTDPAIFFGFSSSPGATYDSPTADPSGSCSSALIYFLQGDTYARFASSNGSAYTVQKSFNCPFANGTTHPAVNHLLRVDVTNWDGLNAMVTFEVDGVRPLDGNGLQIVQKVPYASLAQMKVFAQITSGGSADVMNVDFISAGKYRQLLT